MSLRDKERKSASTGEAAVEAAGDDGVTREKWGKNIEFLLSCVALSVGFGNVWRFPYTALKNGGGAFLIPYLIVLLVVGRPLYYLEMVMGQFSSRGCVRVFDVSPLMRGVGVGQTICICTIIGYYSAVLAIAVRYFVDSFRSPLPWMECQPDWDGCIPSSFQGQAVMENGTGVVSAQLYFEKSVVNMLPDLNNGIGLPDWKLVLCLFACWICIGGLVVKGIRTSGKAAYFLAIFPYVCLLVLLIRACTLEGAGNGIKYFFTPNWEKLLDPNVWYEAITQCFFSLTVGLGAVVVFASFNNFSNNIYRDAMIISWLDTFTSIIAGVIVFGVVGNLAHVTNNDVTDVIKGGPALTFVTYPDAIAKMDFAPNFFAVMFFFMFVLLGLGSNMGAVQGILTSFKDRFPKLATWKIVLGIAIFGFSCALVYITPGGLHVLDVVEYHGVTFASLTLVILEALTFGWIYGVNRVCQDIKFMLGRKTGIFWRFCWGLLTPGLIIAVFILQMFQYSQDVPVGYIVFGWCLYTFTVIVQMVGWGIYATSKRSEERTLTRIREATKPTDDWGPESISLKKDYDVVVREYKASLDSNVNVARKIYQRIFK